MRAFVAPSILLSIARRSSRGFSQGLLPTTGRPCPGSWTSISIPSCSMMTAAGASEDATQQWPLGLDPENCKVVDVRQQLRRRGYTPPSKGSTKAALLEELRGLVRAEGFAPPDATVSDPLTAGGGSKERQRWNPEAGWVDRSAMERGEKGYPLCRFCNEEVSSARRTFCSNGCVHEHRIRTQGSYVRKCLATRDGGTCAECGVDAAGLYKRARAAWVAGASLTHKREAVAREMVGTPFEGKVPAEGATRRPTQGKFWHADHIVPVVRGGGQCSLKNYRTLCVPCHAAATKRLAGERAAARARGTAAATATADGDASPAATASATRAPGPAKRKRGIDRKLNQESSSDSSGNTDTGEANSRRGGSGSSRMSLADALSREDLKEAV